MARLSRGGEAGFTLIEVLVAVTIASLALVGLMRLFSTDLAGVARADTTAQATLLAQSKLEAIGGVILTTLRGGEGNEGPFAWRADIRRFGAPRANDASSYLLPYEVAVQVSWSEGGREHSLALHSIRLGPQK